jgi:hypothetical protein
MTLLLPKIEIAFSTTPDDPSPVWVDVSSYVRCIDGNSVKLIRGRLDRYEEVQPSRLTFTLLNDGRFTPGNTTSPYYPNVKKGRRIRYSLVHNGVTYRRFTGFIDEWPVVWPSASPVIANVTVTASSRTSRLSRDRPLPSIIEIEYGRDTPSAYFTLGDDEGTTRAGNVATTIQNPMVATATVGGSVGQITFGSATGPGTDSLTAASFTRSSPTAGAYLVSTWPTGYATFGAQDSQLLEAFFSSSTTAEMGICQADQFGFFPGQTAYYIGTNASGKLIAVNWGTGTPTYTITSAATVTDGLTHHVAFRETYNGTNTVGDLFLDGVNVGTNSLAGDWTATVHRIVAGGGVVTSASTALNSCFTGTIAHVAYTYNPTTPVADARILAHAQAGLTGFSGERSDQRISRLATYAGIPTADVSVETGLSTSIVNQDTTGQTPISLMQEVTRTEGGVLFDSGDGKLTFHARSHRYNASSSLTLYAATGGIHGELMPSFEPRLDDSDLVNDITASRPNGVTVRAVDTASVTEYGVYRDEITLLTTDDNEVADAASWKLFIGSSPQVKVPSAEADVAQASVAQTTAILAREIGDRATCANLPPQAPATSMDFFIEGSEDTLTGDSHRIVFNLSSASLSGVWQLDSSVYSVLGTSTRLGY